MSEKPQGTRNISLVFILVRLKSSLPFLQHQNPSNVWACACVGVCVGARACMHARAHFCTPISPTDEKQESVLGSIPLLSFRVAAVQPSDNISRKHTFKVSWASSSRWEKEGVCSSRTWGWSQVKYVSLRTPLCGGPEGSR